MTMFMRAGKYEGLMPLPSNFLIVPRPRHLILVSALPLKCQGLPQEALLENQHFVAIPSISIRGACPNAPYTIGLKKNYKSRVIMVKISSLIFTDQS